MEDNVSNEFKYKDESKAIKCFDGDQLYGTYTAQSCSRRNSYQICFPSMVAVGELRHCTLLHSVCDVIAK